MRNVLKCSAWIGFVLSELLWNSPICCRYGMRLIRTMPNDPNFASAEREPFKFWFRANFWLRNMCRVFLRIGFNFPDVQKPFDSGRRAGANGSKQRMCFFWLGYVQHCQNPRFRTKISVITLDILYKSSMAGANKWLMLFSVQKRLNGARCMKIRHLNWSSRVRIFNLNRSWLRKKGSVYYRFLQLIDFLFSN